MNKRTILCLSMALIALAGGLVPARASHHDGSYDVPVWFTWETSQLDVLVFPPPHGQVLNDDGPFGGAGPTEATPFNSYVKAIEAAIGDWRGAIGAYGSEALRTGLEIRSYVVGRDPVPQAALTDPEIVIVHDETKANTLGMAISTRPCIIDNSMWFGKSFSYEDMYNVSAHEVGHCLGLQHIVDGHPEHDVMNAVYVHGIGASGTHLHCASNLDVAGLELAFGRVLGTGEGEMASVPVASYEALPCDGDAATAPSPSPTPTGSPSPTPTPTTSPSESPSPTPTGSPSPSPSPSSSPTASPSPTATPTGSPQDAQRHERSVGLRLVRHLVARGVVRSAGGHGDCSANSQVAIQRRRGGSWKTLATTRAGREGRFRMALRDRRGVYRARLPRRTIAIEGQEHTCEPARSRRVRHRH